MRGIYTSVNEIRKHVFAEIARLSYEYEEGDPIHLEQIPYDIIHGEVTGYRDSVFLERAIVEERLRLAMGLPLRPIAESICKDIPKEACVVVFNQNFECTRLKELAAMFPDLSEHLLVIRDNIKDLLEPFRKGYYYNRAMEGSFSIKKVLPALFPNDPELDYHSLEGVHHGGEAMELFPKIKDMPQEEQEKARRNLLEYCKLDTWATVKIWQKLNENRATVI